MRFRKHLPLAVLILLIVLCIGYSYLRFMVLNDYAVSYEGPCDPSTQSCFVGCNDDIPSDTCTDSYDYSKVEKYAVDLYAECGKDITDCDDANVCLPGDRDCSVTYCDPTDTTDTCSTSASSTPVSDTAP